MVGHLKSVDSGDILAIVLFLLLVGVRYYVGVLIGKAAQRRGSGYAGWVICSLLLGVLVTWAVYMVFVHWRFTMDTPPDPSLEMTFDENAELNEKLHSTQI